MIDVVTHGRATQKNIKHSACDIGWIVLSNKKVYNCQCLCSAYNYIILHMMYFIMSCDISIRYII